MGEGRGEDEGGGDYEGGADYEEDIFKVPLLPGGNSREAIPEDRRGERLPIP